MLALAFLFAAACGSSNSGVPYAGDCVLTASAVSGESLTYGMQAQFGTPVTAPAFCENGQLSGSCCLYMGGGPDGGAVGGPGVSGGILTATDGITPVGTLTYDVGTNGYPPVTGADPWGAGDTLTWMGDGEVAGAFQGSVTAPSLLLGLNPDPGANPLGVTIHRNADLTVSWAPDAIVTTASMELDVSVGMPAEFATLIVCKVADSAGSLVVPTSLLSSLPQNASGYILYQRRNVAVSQGHNVSVNLVAASTAYAAATFP